MALIIGIDPGLNITGWGVLKAEGNRISYINSGIIKTNNKLEIPQRLCQIHDALNDIIDQYSPHQAAIEDTYVNKNPHSSLKLSHARGGILLTLAKHQLPIREYAPLLVKKTVVGSGRAEKNQMIMMVNQILPQAKVSQPDQADALAIAICHINHMSTLVRTELV